jgi:hypothetical protein
VDVAPERARVSKTIMWKRAAFTIAALGALLVASACDDSSSYGGGYGYASAGGGVAGRCGAYKTCGSCTPVLGCGWCSTGGSSGTCADGPEDCSTAPSGWTWDPQGCGDIEGGATLGEGGRTPAQPGVGQPDAGGSVDMGNDGSADTDAGDNGGDASSEAGGN